MRDAVTLCPGCTAANTPTLVRRTNSSMSSGSVPQLVAVAVTVTEVPTQVPPDDAEETRTQGSLLQGALHATTSGHPGRLMAA